MTAVVRSDSKADDVRAAGATAVQADLFDRAAMRVAIEGHDTVAHLATHIPTGPSAALRSGWLTNDSLRRDAASAIAGAVTDAGADVGVGRMIQESITFPYVDGGDEWIDEDHERIYYWGNRSTVDAEAAAAGVTPPAEWESSSGLLSSWRPTAITPRLRRRCTAGCVRTCR